jgi:hypothetical protein
MGQNFTGGDKKEREIRLSTKELGQNEDPLERALLSARIKEVKSELHPLKRESTLLLKHINGKKEPETNNAITDEMIEHARQHPITRIVAFTSGRKTTCCPFHKDSNPSMSLYENHVHCFVCNRSWDPISAMMDSEKVSFRDAVLALQ